MDRERFETGLDTLIAAHGRKVRAGIDAAACQTRWDWDKSHQADEAYLDAHEAFLAEVFAPPPPEPVGVPFVIAREEQDRGRTRGRPLVWRRCVDILIASRGVMYTFTANLESLTVSSKTVESGDTAELQSPDFDPLSLHHSIRFRGLEYTTTDAGPEDLVKIAVETCRVIALRLFAHGIDYFAATQPWPKGVPSLAEIVQGEVQKKEAA